MCGFFPMPLLFVLTLPQLYVAQRVSTVLHMLVCSVAEVSLGKKLGHWWLDGVQVCTLVCLFVLDLLLGLGFWFWVFFVGFFQCVCTQKGRIFRKPLVLLSSVYILSSYINQITNFSNEQRDLKPPSVWQYCVFPAGRRGRWGVSWTEHKELFIFAEGATAHLGELSCCRTRVLDVEWNQQFVYLLSASITLFPCNCSVRPCVNPFDSCCYLLFLKCITTCELHT